MPVRRSAQSSALACLFVGETFMPTGTYSRAAYSTAVQPSVFRADGRPKGRYPRRVCTKIGVFVVQPSTGTRTEDTIETQTQPPKDSSTEQFSKKHCTGTYDLLRKVFSELPQTHRNHITDSRQKGISRNKVKQSIRAAGFF
jgi:hypothetical protein